MKKLVIVLTLLLALTSYSQTISVSGGQDIKMAYEGPYHGKINDIGPTWNLEFRAMCDWESWRLWTGLEFHQEIGYRKWTYFALDYRIADPYVPFTNIQLRNFILYAGAELGEIRIHKDYTDYHDPDNYIENSVTNFLPGINGEVKYKIKNSPLAFSIGANAFQAEFELRKYKKIRTDVFFIVTVDLFKIK